MKLSIFKKPYPVAIFILTLFLVVPLVGAQDDTGLSAEEQEWLTTITTAHENLQSLDTYHVALDQNIEQTIGMAGMEGMEDMGDMGDMGAAGGLSFDQIITQTIDIQVRTNGMDQPNDIYSQIHQTIESTAPGMGSNMELTMETLVLNGKTYLRFTEIGQMPQGSGASLPENWVEMGDFSPGSQFLSSESLANLPDQQQRFLNMLDDETVASIEQLASETLNGQTMDVYKLTWSSGAFDELLAGMMGTGSLQTQQNQSVQEFMQSLFENASGSQQVWIGTEDGLPHRTVVELVIEEAELTMQQQSMTLSQTTTSTANYQNFNADVSIPTPEIASESGE